MCRGCICEHCANSVECFDHCTGEMDEPCFTCDECIYYDGKSDRRVMWRDECPKYKITEYWAAHLPAQNENHLGFSGGREYE